jgi:hypothetical protein
MFKLSMFLFLSFFLFSGVSANFVEISSCQELQDINFNLSSKYFLIRDIDCSETRNWNCDGSGDSCLGFRPLGNLSNPFIGSFNGNDFEISNLFINSSIEDYAGFFGVLNGEVYNVSLINNSILGRNYVGGFAGLVLSESSISRVIFDGDVKSSGNFIGGFIGKNEGFFSYVFLSSKVELNQGLVGYFIGENIGGSKCSFFDFELFRHADLVGKGHSEELFSFKGKKDLNFLFLDNLIESLCIDPSVNDRKNFIELIYEKFLNLFKLDSIDILGSIKSLFEKTSSSDIESAREVLGDIRDTSYFAKYSTNSAGVKGSQEWYINYHGLCLKARIKQQMQGLAFGDLDIIISGKLDSSRQNFERLFEMKSCSMGICTDMSVLGGSMLNSEFRFFGENSFESIDKKFIRRENLLNVETFCFDFYTESEGKSQKTYICLHPQYNIIMKMKSSGSSMLISDLTIGENSKYDFILGEDLDNSLSDSVDFGLEQVLKEYGQDILDAGQSVGDWEQYCDDD